MHGRVTIRKRAPGKRLALGLAAAGLAGATLIATLGVEPEDHARATTSQLVPAAAESLPPSRVDYRRLEERIARVMQEPDMVGLAIGTIEGGHVRFIKGYGETLAGSGDPVTPSTVFRWASVSKGVASALVAKLAEEGRLSLDAPVLSMRTSLTLPGDARRVTVADLLAHRVGLVSNAWDTRLEAGEDPHQLRATLGTLPALCPPGTCYAYQNIAYDAASEIIGGVTGQTYADAARTRLFQPLGMDHTSIGRAGLQTAASWAHPHHYGRSPAIVNDSYYRIPAAGGVNSSISDLVRWMNAQMGSAPGVLSPRLLETMHRPRVKTPPRGRRAAMDRALTDAAYGLGWRSFTYAGHHLVGHRGSVDGYGSLVLFDPAEKSGIAMLWNSSRHIAARLQLEFFDMLYGRPATDWLELPPTPATVRSADHQTRRSNNG